MLLKNQSLSQVMHYPLITVAPTWKVMDALLVARDKEVHHLPVVEGDDLVGLLCSCDMREAQPNESVGKVMRQPVPVLEIEDTARVAAQLMQRTKFGSVVVMEGRRPAGIVTRGDLLERYADANDVLDVTYCECCGLTHSVELNKFGQMLCALCSERATGDAWFELGGTG